MTIEHMGHYESLIQDVRENPQLAGELLRDPKAVLAKYALTEAEAERIKAMGNIEIHFDDDVKHVVIPIVKPGIGPQFVCC